MQIVRSSIKLGFNFGLLDKVCLFLFWGIYGKYKATILENTYFQIHSRTTEERDTEENWTCNFENLKFSMLEHIYI